MGDSKTEGTGVSAIGDRWLNVLMTGLRARHAPTGDQGLGYLPAYYATFYGFSTAPTFTGSVTTLGYDGGLGNRAAHMAAGASVTWTVPAWTSGVPLLVHYTRRPDVGSIEVVTGGTVRATISTTGAAASMVASVTIPAGTTSITIRHKSGTGSGNAARVEGIVHRTATTGVIVYDAAHSGGKVVDYTEGVAASSVSDDRHWEAVAAVAPHAIIMAFGANDQSDPPGGRTAAQWANDLRAAVARAKAAAPGAGVILLHGAQRTQEAGDPARILAFEAAAREAIGADPDVSILYESSLWAPVVGEDYSDGDGVWLSDTVHTNATANRAIARMLLDATPGSIADGRVGPLSSNEPPTLNPGTLSISPGYSYAFQRTVGNPSLRIAPSKVAPLYGAYMIDVVIECTGTWSGTVNFSMLTGGDYFPDTVMGGSTYATPTLSVGTYFFRLFRIGTDWRVTYTKSA